MAAGQEHGAGADGAEAGDPAAGNDGDGSADGRPGDPAPEDADEAPADGVIAAAESAAYWSLDYLTEFFPFEPPALNRLNMLAGNETSNSTNAMAALIRQIGRERATPAVLLQQLVLLKHLQPAEPSRAELAIVRIFAAVVAELDQFEAEWQAEQAAAERPPAAPAPVPIDETTLELVDGPFDTWGSH